MKRLVKTMIPGFAAMAALLAGPAYAELKIELAERHPTDIVAYMDGKDGLIKQLEAEALVWYRSGGKATA